jgi:uncharacterized delta-60 repeat protein
MSTYTDRLRRTHARFRHWGRGGARILAGLLLLPVGVMAQEAGDLDTSFGVEGRVITDFGDTEMGRALAVQSDGKIIVVGNTGPMFNNDSGEVTSLARFALARYLPDGALDTSFGEDGRVTTAFQEGTPNGEDGPAQAVALQPDGKIVAAGYARVPPSFNVSFALARYLADGSLDATFGDDGKVTTDIGALLGIVGANARASAVVLQPDGKIVAVGGNFFVRYHADGALDASFGEGGVTTIGQRPMEGTFDLSAAALQPDGKIVAAGFVNNLNTSPAFPFVSSFVLARVLPDGAFDTSFGSDGLVKTNIALNAEANAVALQPDGKIVAAGRTVEATDDPNIFARNFTLARYLPDGMLDTSFGSGGLVTTDFGGGSSANGVILQPDGKIVAAGSASNESDFALARYLQDGALDTTFSGDGLVTTPDPQFSFALGLALQPDGRLVLAGATLSGAAGFADFDFALARYESGLVLGRGPPTSKEECKRGGWRTFNIPREFKNQGDCIRFVMTGK